MDGEAERIEKAKFETIRSNDVNDLMPLRPLRPPENKEVRDREQETLRIVRKWHREKVETRNHYALIWTMALAALGILLVVGGTVWGTVIVVEMGEISDNTDGSSDDYQRILSLGDDARMAANLVQYGILIALVCMFISVVILALAAGYRLHE